MFDTSLTVASSSLLSVACYRFEFYKLPQYFTNYRKSHQTTSAMVLTELGSKITNALRKMADSTVINDEVLDEMLKDICNALVTADVNVQMVIKLRQNLKNRLKLEEMAAGLNRRKSIRKAVFDELCALLDPGVKPFKPTKGKSNVIMFVGLQGSGKTTTIAKLAYYYKRKGWKACMVCADTFRAGAFDQLKQNAALAKVPYYGSYSETDPVKLAKDGVEQFKKEGYEYIIVDTSGRHKQEEALFEEMEQVANVIKPDNIVFVMDGSIGQAAYDQALAFKQRVAIGSIIITKLDGHAKGGGALSAVAATRSPIIFLGTGEHLEDLEEFEVEPFVSRLLGMGHLKGVIDLIKERVPMEGQEEAAKRIQAGKFTLRDMYEQFQNMLKMGPLNKVIEMIPGMSNLLQGQKGDAGTQKIKSYMTIMDSMTDEELDNPKILNQSRMLRIARGSGKSLREVNELITQYKSFEKVIGRMKGLKPGRGSINQLQNLVNPQILKQMGGAGGLNSLIRQMSSQMGGNLKNK
jgi:signal recognition particle subunit SRP54